MKNCVQNLLIILAAGKGERFQAGVPKQFVKIRGRELLQYSIEEMRRSKKADHLIVVLNQNEEDIQHVRREYNVDVIPGGAERAYSFQNAIDYANNNFPSCKKISFHEAARPLVTHEVIDRHFELLDKYDYVETCKKISDSLGSYIVESPRREDYYLIQAPESYRLSVLIKYYNCNSSIYFAANQFPSFVKGYQDFDVHNNFKLTTPEDKALIEYLIGEREKTNE